MGKVFEWCGYTWDCKMEGGRIIHPLYPYNWLSDSDDVLTIDEKGEMTMTFRENPKDVTYWNGQTYHPTIERALIRSLESFDFGTFSLEAIMPKGYNVGANFWLSGDDNWPPEIDICEAWGENNDYFHIFTNYFPWIWPSWKTTTNVHYRDDELEHQHIKSKSVSYCKQKLNPTENWIKYECEWLPDKITFKANGKVTRTVGKKVSNMLINNLNTPEHGYRMDVIIDINPEDPTLVPLELISPFKVRNFKYIPA